MELPRRAYLAVELAGDDVAFTPNGLVVDGVLPGGMAEYADVRTGDVITAVDGMPVRTLAELAAALRAAGRALTTTIAYRRGDAAIARDVATVPAPRDAWPGIAITHGELAVAALGARLRTIETRGAAPRALILALQGIACDTIEVGPIAELARGWAEAGFETLRVDKPGVGDSEGAPCHAVDFETELACFTAAAERAAARAREREIPLVVFGHSVGAIVAAELAPRIAPAAIVVYGAPTTTWIACLTASMTRQLALRGVPDDEIERVLERSVARSFDDGFNGRSAAYHRQLDRVDPAASWSRVRAPVLVVRGEHDWVVATDEQARICALVPHGELIDLPGLDHVMGWHPDRAASLRDYGAGRFDPAIVGATVRWLEKILIPSAA